MVQIVGRSKLSRYGHVQRINRYLATAILSEETGKDYTDADLTDLIDAGKIEVIQDGRILLASVERYLLTIDGDSMSGEALRELVGELRQAVIRCNNAMCRINSNLDLVRLMVSEIRDSRTGPQKRRK